MADNIQAKQQLEQALLDNPQQPALWRELGEKHLQRKKLPEARKAFENALRLDDTVAASHLGLAAISKEQGCWQEAIHHYRQGLVRDPVNIDGLLALGVLLAEHDQRSEAIEQWRAVVRLNPAHCQAVHNLGVAFAQNGDAEESAQYLRRALELKPDYAEAHYNLANVFNSNEDRGKSAKALGAKDRHRKRNEAVEHYLAAVRIRPDYIESYHNLGSVLIDLQRPAEATVWLRQAVRLCQSAASGNGQKHTLLPSALNQLGLALGGAARYGQAERCFHQALAAKPDMSEVHSNLGNLYQEQGRLPEALASYELAMAHDPQSVSTRWNRSLSLLQSGDFEQGWREYEWRWQRKQTPARPFSQPRWDGSPQPDRTLLIFIEQGLGDILQFIRFAALARKRVGRVIVECPGFVMPLLGRCAGVDEVVAEGRFVSEVAAQGVHTPRSPGDLAQAFDLQIPLMSLPGVLGTTLATIPNRVPYLFVDEVRVVRWRAELLKSETWRTAPPAPPCQGVERMSAPPLRVGVVWQGNPNHRLDRYRSIPLAEFGVLARIAGLQLISLQKGPGAAQLEEARKRFAVLEPPITGEMTAEALLDTAALMKCLDLVISVDTGTAHLAGALGVPIWVPLSAIGEWRWLLHREDSPWYPTMRLFRQKKLGSWRRVFQRMAREVTKIRKIRVTPPNS
jgi:tetratricopeptide (TPR) repeat protein